MTQTLYICYFGLREPLVQTQVLPYLREIRKLDDLDVSLLTFEPDLKNQWTAEQIEIAEKKLADEGIAWYSLPYHKRPSVPATVYDILNGARLVRKLLKAKNIDVLHARIHFPAIMGALARKFSRRKPKLIFDIRGFIPEEYTDAGVWKENGLIYRTVKALEKWLLKESDAFVVLTERARGILFPESEPGGFDKAGRPVEVIPCCVDLERFGNADGRIRDEIRTKLSLTGRRVIIYVGSFGGWYMTEEMLDLFAAARADDPKSFAMILTQRDKERVASRLRERGFSESDFLVDSVSPEEISKYLSAADVAISFIRACYSKQSSSPTKIAEYLAAGLPIITNRGVGDIDGQIEADGTGVVIDEFSRASYLNSLRRIAALRESPDLANKCRQSAFDRFDLGSVGGRKYRLLYNRVLKKDDAEKDREIPD